MNVLRFYRYYNVKDADCCNNHDKQRKVCIDFLKISRKVVDYRTICIFQSVECAQNDGRKRKINAVVELRRLRYKKRI